MRTGLAPWEGEVNSFRILLNHSNSSFSMTMDAGKRWLPAVAWNCPAAAPSCTGFRFQVSGFGLRVSGFGVQVSGFGFRVSSLRFGL